MVRPGYKQTEVGEIPEDWDVKDVVDAYEICNTLRLPISAKEREKMHGPYPYYGPTRIQDYINEYRVEGEYALIGEDGDHFLKYSSVSQTQLARGKFNVNNHAHLVKGVNNKTKWFYYFFRNRDISIYLTRQGAGRFKLNKSALGSLPCILPSILEQEKITNTLSDVDDLIASLEKLIAKKRDIKTATMQQLLTGKKRLPGFGEGKGYKQTELGQIPEDWDVVAFDKIASLRKNRINPKITGGGDLCIELEHIEQNKGTVNGRTLTTDNSSIKSVFSKGDVLFGKLRSYLRKYLLAEFDGVCSTEIWVFQAVRNKSIPDFLYQVIQTDKFIECASEAYGTHMPRADWNVVKEFAVGLPDIKEQEEIASILNDMNEEITILEVNLNKTKAIKQGMMQELLTGRTRLIKPHGTVAEEAKMQGT